MTTSFRYRAVDARGSRVHGILEADSEIDLESRLARLGLDLIRCRSASGRALIRPGRRVPRAELINFTFHLQQLLIAGVPIVDALRDLGESTSHRRFRDVVAALLHAIENGRTFSESLRGFPAVYDPVYTSVVHVGEQSGCLERVLGELTDALRWHDELIARARRALLYPAFAAAVVVPAMVVLLVVLVPRLTGLLAMTGSEMPAHTRALLATAGFLANHGDLMLSVVGVTTAAGAAAVRASRPAQRAMDRAKLRLWLLGPILYRIRIARFCRYFALMYAAGIAVLDALALSRALLANAALEAALGAVHERIAAGGGIADSFAQAGLFAPLVVRMLGVGERSGAMDRALLNASYFYDRQVRAALDGLTAMLGPALVLVMALLLGWIVLSTLPPLYAAVTAFGP